MNVTRPSILIIRRITSIRFLRDQRLLIKGNKWRSKIFELRTKHKDEKWDERCCKPKREPWHDLCGKGFSCYQSPDPRRSFVFVTFTCACTIHATRMSSHWTRFVAFIVIYQRCSRDVHNVCTYISHGVPYWLCTTLPPLSFTPITLGLARP